MKPERAALLEVIESVADGASLDWDALEANITDEGDRRMHAQLKILARIAEVHRTQPDDPADRVIPTRSAKVIPIKPGRPVDESALPLRSVASSGASASPALAPPAAPAHLAAASALAPATAAVPSDPIGRWGSLELLQRIGEGTFGEVYRARDPLHREVALKLLRTDRGPVDRLGEKVLR